MTNRVNKSPEAVIDRNGASKSAMPSAPSDVVSLAKTEALALKDSIEHWIHEHPATSLAVALGVGVTIGWLVKRS